MPSSFARRDLVWAQAALRCLDTAVLEPESRAKVLHEYYELLEGCIQQGGEDYDLEAGYHHKQAIKDVLSDDVVIPEPSPIAVTEFSKLTGYDSNEAQQVLPHLWIGNPTPAKVTWLEAHGVSHVVRCYDASGYRSCEERDEEYKERGITLLQLPLDDNAEQEILSFLPDAHRFIHQAIGGGGSVLIHCGAGISRCCAVTSSYIMATLRCNYHQALAIVRAARPIVGPNAGFSRQLKEWEEVAMSGAAAPG